ncbi:MAG: hypothetical protein JST06_09050 [Bacteroidetes bacterium]|nr:hypothetical protein [Bacteroidota bacterium]MBS1629330.1 hypothetical protein [Bacteroidota bacterium]
MKTALKPTIIIPFFPTYRKENSNKKEIEPLALAAWDFARCALWPEQQFTTKQVDAVMRYIREYFKAAIGKRRAFSALCQRVILTKKYISKSSERFVPEPAIWFNRRYPFGFAGTLPWFQNVEQRRKEVPGYLGHIEELAEGYYTYAMKPTKKALIRFRSRMENHHAPSLQELFHALTQPKENTQRA